MGSKYGDSIELQEGVHRYDFSVPLSPRFPESLNGKYGNIRYTIEALLDVPWGTGSGLHEIKSQFTLARNDDLNAYPDLQIHSTCEEIKRFCCFCCESDPLIMTVVLPRTGYVPGETIQVSISYNNKSNVEVSYTKINFKRFITFKR